MVDIHGRPFVRVKSKTSTDIDLSTELKKYATKEEVDELLNLVGVDPDEVAIFPGLNRENLKRATSSAMI